MTMAKEIVIREISMSEAIRETWDVVIIGAGISGTVTAGKLAERGCKVLIIEKKPLVEIGRKICGDAIGAHHFKRTGIKPPSASELDAKYSGIRVHSPDLETVFFVNGEGFSVNRYVFGQRLLREALKNGAYLLSSSIPLDIILDQDSVKELIIKKYNETGKIKSRVFVDASGWQGVLRRKVAKYMNIEANFSEEDLVLCYREIINLKKPVHEPDVCDIYLDVNLCPGGYAWVFPKRNGELINVGVGIQLSTHTNPRQRFEIFIRKQNFEGEVLNAGAAIVPTRRPLDTMVWNGLVIVGDAASTVNPIHGGGIGHAMYSACLCAEIVSNALNENDLSMERLWEFNVRYMRQDGARNAKLDVFRIFLQRVTNEEINYGMKARLVDEQSLSSLRIEETEESTVKEKLEKVLRALKRPSLLRKLLLVRKVMRQVREAYEDYPESPRDFIKWKNLISKIFETYKTELVR